MSTVGLTFKSIKKAENKRVINNNEYIQPTITPYLRCLHLEIIITKNENIFKNKPKNIPIINFLFLYLLVSYSLILYSIVISLFKAKRESSIFETVSIYIFFI